MAKLTLRTLAREINDHHRECSEAAARALLHARHAGERLTEAKSRLPHGQWLSWLRENVSFSERTAQAYMRVAGRWAELESKAQHVADLPLRDGLRLLAEPRPASIQHVNELQTERLHLMAAIGTMLNHGERFGFKKLHNLNWLSDLSDQQLGELFGEMSMSVGLRREIEQQAANLPDGITFDEAWQLAGETVKRHRDDPTPWSRLEDLAREFMDDPTAPVTLEDIAIGISRFDRAA